MHRPTDLDRIKLALQGYNYGSAYIDWAMERDGGYTMKTPLPTQGLSAPARLELSSTGTRSTWIMSCAITRY